MRRWAAAIAIMALVIYYVRYTPSSYERYADRRERVALARPASNPQREVIVAVVWPKAMESFWQGASLAETEINASGGVVVGKQGEEFVRRPLRLRRFDEASHNAGLAIVGSIAKDSSIVAVVGHEVSKECTAVATKAYHSGGVLFVVPTSNEEAYTLHNFENVFRLAPTVTEIGQAFADAAARLAANQQIRVAVLYPLESKLARFADTSAERVGYLLELSANKLLDERGMPLTVRVVFSHGFKQGKDQYLADIEPLLKGRELYDVILILDVLPTAADLRRDLDRHLNAMAEGKWGHGKLILDLEQLDWTLRGLSYAGYREQNSPALAAKSGPLESDLAIRDLLMDRAAELLLRESKLGVAVLTQRDDYNRFYGIQLSSKILKAINVPATGIRSGDELRNRLYVKLLRTYEQPPATQSDEHGPNLANYSELAAEVRQSRVNFVFIAGMGRPAIGLIKDLRKSGLAVPIVCAPHLEHEILWGKALEPAERENTYVVSSFDPGIGGQATSRFAVKYKDSTGTAPDALAAAGYQSIKLLENGFRQAGTTLEKNVVQALLFSSDLDEGPFGKPRFSPNGDLQGLKMVLKTRSGDHVRVIPLETSTR